MTFDFHPSWTQDTRGALGLHQIKKLHKTKSNHHLILGGVPFIRNIEIPKFWSGPRPAPPSGPVLSGLLCLVVQKGVTQPTCPKITCK